MKLRKKITLTFISILIISQLIIGIVSYIIIENIVTQNALHNLKSISTAQLNYLENIYEQNLERLKLVSSRTQLRLSLKEYNQNAEKQYIIKLEKILKDARSSIPDFKEISLINLEGIIVASTNNESIGTEHSDKHCFLKGQKENIANHFFLDKDMNLNIHLSGPLILDNELLGVLLITTKGDKITNFATDYSLLGETGYTLLVIRTDEKNKFIVSPRRINGKNTKYEYANYNDFGQISRKVIEKQKGTYKILYDYLNEPMSAVVNYSNKLEIGYSVRLSREEILRPVIRYRNILVIISIFSFLIVFIYTFWSVNIITKPVLKLTTLAKKISGGDLDQKIEIKSKDEIGILGKAFNTMAGILKQDISARRKAEEELKKESDRYKSFITVSNTGAWEYNYDTDFLWCSPEYFSMLGRNTKQFDISGKSNLKETWIDLLHPEDRERASSHFSDYLKNGSVGMYENYFRMKHSDGHWVWILSRGSTLHDIKGEITNTTVGTHINITERKKAEEELSKHREHLEELVKERTAKLEKSQQSLALLLEDVNESRTELDISNKKLENSNKELEAFAYSVSHDLRAPLRAIDGFTRILTEDYIEKLDDEGKRLGAVIQKNSRKMGKLIDDLLAFSRLGRASMQFSSIDMKNMAKAIYHEATGSSERKRINFSVADLPDVDGDSNMFRQVWMNLISNAIKFSSKREKAVISITGIQDDEKITYRISDNGAGFDMQYKNKIFDVFQRLHNERDFPGTGVGLALVRRIINRHNGKIWAESEVDKGATFYFSLPKKVK